MACVLPYIIKCNQWRRGHTLILEYFRACGYNAYSCRISAMFEWHHNSAALVAATLVGPMSLTQGRRIGGSTHPAAVEISNGTQPSTLVGISWWGCYSSQNASGSCIGVQRHSLKWMWHLQPCRSVHLLKLWIIRNIFKEAIFSSGLSTLNLHHLHLKYSDDSNKYNSFMLFMNWPQMQIIFYKMYCKKQCIFFHIYDFDVPFGLSTEAFYCTDFLLNHNLDSSVCGLCGNLASTTLVTK